jgi:FkbM family methyltransferase
MIIRIYTKLLHYFLSIYFIFNKRFLYKDKFGLRYFLYKNTRPLDTLRKKVRTDDTTVLECINTILDYECQNHNKDIQCIDVGSYIGVISLLMSKIVASNKRIGFIHSFEMVKSTYGMQIDNIKKNSFADNIKINNVALLDKEGTESVCVLDNPGQNHIISNEVDISKKVMTKTITLYSYLKSQNIEKVTLCKIDAEGVDHYVLKGLYTYLTEGKVDFLIIEFENSDISKKIESLLNENNYSIYFMVRNKNYIVDSFSKYPLKAKGLLNILAVSPSADTASIVKLSR